MKKARHVRLAVTSLPKFLFANFVFILLMNFLSFRIWILNLICSSSRVQGKNFSPWEILDRKFVQGGFLISSLLGGSHTNLYPGIPHWENSFLGIRWSPWKWWTQILTGFDCRLVGFSIFARKIRCNENFRKCFASVARTIHGRRD